MSSSSPQIDQAQQIRASVATWMGMLFVLVLLLMAVGGFVRLNDAGASLAGWPMVEGGFLPPITTAGWTEHYQAYCAQLDALRAREAAGEVGLGYIPADPADLGTFRRLYLMEFSHRLLAVLAFIVACVCAVRLLRHPGLRRLAGAPLSGIVSLIVVQSGIGGVLVLTGASGNWLFLHLATATLTLACILWSLLLLLRGSRQPVPVASRRRRRPVTILAWSALVAVLLQLVLGALVAGTRHQGMSTTWPLMNGEFIPTLWQTGAGVTSNLLANPVLHQWTHRVFALIVAVIIVGLALWPNTDLGLRCRIARRFTLSCLVTQMVLGVINVLSGASTLIAMAHLMVAIVLFCGIVLVLFDCRNEEAVVEGATADDAVEGLDGLERVRA